MVQPAPSPSRVALAVAHQTDPGLDPDKQINEDACAAGEVALGSLLVVCDGMGGHMGGKDASEAAIRTIFSDLESAQPGTNPGAALKAAIEHAGRVVFDLGGPGANMLRPGSTVVAVLAHAGGSEIAHVGDSRAYLIRSGQIHPLTRDHSMVQQMIDAGVLKPQEAAGHPDANKITRALGMTAVVEVELRPTPLAHHKGDIFLLASDGLCDLVGPEDLLSVTTQARQAQGLDHACQQLVATANARGGHDNITVLLAEVLDCPPCTESKTVIPDEQGPATMPVVPVTSPDAAAGAGVHPTMVDDGTGVTPAPGPVATAPDLAAPALTWIGDEPHDGVEGEHEAEATRRRRLTWLIVGAALVLFGLLLVISSIWWVFAATSARDSSENWRIAERRIDPCSTPLAGSDPLPPCRVAPAGHLSRISTAALRRRAGVRQRSMS